MLNFFRHIRKSLFGLGQARKYLPYAIGEIALVVIGILIALRINNWNEWRKERKIETSFLSDINTGFSSNRIQFERTLNLHLEQIRRCNLIIEQFPITENNWDSISSVYMLNPNNPAKQTSNGGSLLEFVPTFNPSQSSIESLMASSSFDIVSNERLKKLLISWKDLLLDYQENEEQELAFIQNNLEPFRLQYIRLSKDQDGRFVMKLHPDRRNMFESLIRQRRYYLGFIADDSVGEVALIRHSIDLIIELTNPFAKQ